MKAGTESKIKFKRFKRRLKLPHWQAVGILEAIWQLTAHSAPEGDIGRHSNEDIAASIEYDGDEDELVSALIDSGWLDACEVHRLVVHDWAEHAPNYVKGNIQRHGKQFAKVASPGEPPREPPRERPLGILPPSLVKPSLVKPSQAKPSQAKPKESLETSKTDWQVDDIELPKSWNGSTARIALEDMVNHRRQIRVKPLTLAGVNILLGKFHTADEFRQAVDTSISNGWTGVFPERNGKKISEQLSPGKIHPDDRDRDGF